MTIAETVYEKLKAAPPEIAQEVLDFLEFLEAKKKAAGAPSQPPTACWEDFFGTLRGSGVFEGDPVDIQRKMRDEWDH